MDKNEFECLTDMLPLDVNWGDALTPQIAQAIVQAARQSAGQERGEAVGWMCQHSGSCWFTQSEVRADMHRNAGWDVTPVYTAPTAAQSRIAELEAVRWMHDTTGVVVSTRPFDFENYTPLYLPDALHARDDRIAALEAQLTESREREGRMREAAVVGLAWTREYAREMDAYEISEKAISAAKQIETMIFGTKEDNMAVDSIAAAKSLFYFGRRLCDDIDNLYMRWETAFARAALAAEKEQK